MTHRDAHLELIAGYALGVLDETERREIDAHLAEGCTLCEAELREASEVADALALAIDPVTPPADVKTRLLERVQGDAAAEAPTRWGWSPLALAASVVLALGLGGRVWMLNQALETERRATADAQALAARTTDDAGRIEELQRRLARAEGVLALLTGPDVRTVSLAGQEAAPGAHARAFVDPSGGRLVLYVYDLPPPPPGKTYQLWVILGGTPVSAGTFGVEADGRAHYESQPAASFGGEVTVAVTVEPAGGVPSPTGPMVLVGS